MPFSHKCIIVNSYTRRTKKRADQNSFENIRADFTASIEEIQMQRKPFGPLNKVVFVDGYDQ
jgi:hypothetical protein